LLDTNVFLTIIGERVDSLKRLMREALISSESAVHVSVASLWEIAIKVRLGKLALGMPLGLLPELTQRLGLELIAINHHHSLTAVEPEPATRDPFDRLLLAQCLIENLRLVTIDRVLVAHPLAWRA
jgi:PIN domain nuclease of toxin-antitoxin system